MIFNIMYDLAELTEIQEESMLQEANRDGVTGDMKFSSNLDKSLLTFHSQHHFLSSWKA